MVCTTLNYIERFLIRVSTITGSISISVFAFLLGIPIATTSSAIESKICAVVARTKRFKSIINKEKKKRDKTILLPKSKLNSMQVLISKALIDANISHDEFVSINNVLKEYDKINQKCNKLFSLKKILVHL